MAYNDDQDAQQKQPDDSGATGSKDKNDRLLPSIQEDIVTAVVYKNDDYTNQIVKLLDLDWFEDPYRDIVERALQQRETYKQAPGLTHVDDIFGAILFDPAHKKYKMYNRILVGMMRISEDLNTQYVFDHLHHFARRQCLKRALFDAGTILSQTHDPADYDRVEEILTGVSKFKFVQKLPSFNIKERVTREYPPYLKIMGDLVTSHRRVMMVGPKSVGKTRFNLELALSAASGRDFLHWQGSGQSLRVLYIDGEMGRRKMDGECLPEALMRYKPWPENMHVVCYDDEGLSDGGIPYLNTKKGRRWLEQVIESIGGADLIIFDNIHSLLQRDDSHGEKTWSETEILVKSLTARNIGQIWIDHTGHNTSRNGESDQKTWLMDAVGLMTRAPDKAVGTVEFTLDFKIKDRAADQQNRRDFQEVDIKFENHEWSFIPSNDNKKKPSTTDAPEKPGKKGLSDDAVVFYAKLLQVIDERGVFQRLGDPPQEHQTVREKADWKAACWVPGLLEQLSLDPELARKQHAKFSNMRRELLEKGWIGRHHDEKKEHFIWKNRA